MSELSPEKLQEIEKLAGLQFLPEQIAIIIDHDIDDLEEHVFSGKGPVYMSFMRGQLKAEAEVRTSILQMAKQGSTPAQKQLLDIIASNKKFMNGEDIKTPPQKPKK